MEKKGEEVDEIELKRRRKRDREAARFALDHLQRSVEFDDNLEAEKEIGLLCGWSRPYHYYVNVGDRNPTLSQIGLSLKHEFDHEDDDDDEEEKVIFCGDTNMNKCNFNLNNPLLSQRQVARVAMLKSRFMDVISKSQHQLGLLDHHKSTKDLKKQQQQQQQRMIKEEDHMKKKLMVIKVVDGGFKKPRRQSKSKLATIKTSFYRSQRRCYDMLH